MTVGVDNSQNRQIFTAILDRSLGQTGRQGGAGDHTGQPGNWIA